MPWVHLLIAHLIWFLSATSGAVSVSPQFESVGYCRLQETPEAFSGKVILVRAKVEKSRHGLFLTGDACEGSVLLELRADVTPKRDVALTRDAEFASFDGALFDFKPGTTELKNQIEATFEGRFDTVFQVRHGKRVRVGAGYGPNSVLASRLVLHKISDLKISEKTK